MQSSLPGHEYLIQCHAVTVSLNRLLAAFYGNVQLQAYGSLASNLQLPSSDVDLCITFQGVEDACCQKGWRRDVLTSVADILWRKCPPHLHTIHDPRSYQFIGHARIPIVSFSHRHSGTCPPASLRAYSML
jgi:Nucleotidyltransferase domain